MKRSRSDEPRGARGSSGRKARTFVTLDLDCRRTTGLRPGDTSIRTEPTRRTTRATHAGGGVLLEQTPPLYGRRRKNGGPRVPEGLTRYQRVARKGLLHARGDEGGETDNGGGLAETERRLLHARGNEGKGRAMSERSRVSSMRVGTREPKSLMESSPPCARGRRCRRARGRGSVTLLQGPNT